MGREMQYFLGVRELDLIVKTFHPVMKEFQRGEIIIRASVREDRFCLLLGGTAYLEVENEYDSKQILDYFVKGQILCHDMLIKPNNGHCYVIAKHPCKIACIEREAIERYKGAHSDDPLGHLCEFVFQSMLYASQQHCHILQQKTIHNKLLAFLYYQAELQNSYTVRLPLPYSDLADYLAVDRSAMMKELSKMNGSGLIEKKAHQIRLNV